MSIESEVIAMIKPSEEEVAKIQKAADSLMLEVKDYILRNNIDVQVRYVGSFSKGTYLSNPDLDLFLMFPESTPKDEIVKIGLKMGEELINGEKQYAEHPYTTGMFQGVEVDMVPCYHITSTEKLLTPVDRSPFHTDYVLSKADERMCDEIRLMKRFMKGIGTYGAEPNTRGFSGYMCELITNHDGGFIDAVIAAAEWKEGVTIVLEKKGPPMVSPIVLYDPVDPRRNVASAVHIDTFAEFVVACRSYLKNPTKEFFFPREREPMSEEEIRKKIDLHGSRLITVTFSRPEINQDNLHSQVWKTQIAIAKKLDAFSFNVLRAVHEITDDRVVTVFEVERDQLSKTYKHIGPPVWVKSSESFMMKWKDSEYGSPFIEDGHWTVIAERQYFTAAEMLADEIEIAGIGREIDPKTMKILDHDSTISDTDPVLLSELLDAKHRWEL